MQLTVVITRDTGATPEEVREPLIQVATYAGAPAAIAAFRIAKDALADAANPGQS